MSKAMAALDRINLIYLAKPISPAINAAVFTNSFGDADELIAYPSPCETDEGTEIQLPILALNGDCCSKGCSRHL